MNTDFTVVMHVRHYFGDHVADWHQRIPYEDQVPDAGVDATFEFVCAQVNPSEEGLLVFQARGATAFEESPIHVNGIKLNGGVPQGSDVPSPGSFASLPVWTTRLLIIPSGVLRETNTVRIQCTQTPDRDGSMLVDDFLLDNMVVWFKTREGRTGEQAGNGDVAVQP